MKKCLFLAILGCLINVSIKGACIEFEKLVESPTAHKFAQTHPEAASLMLGIYKDIKMSDPQTAKRLKAHAGVNKLYDKAKAKASQS